MADSQVAVDSPAAGSRVVGDSLVVGSLAAPVGDSPLGRRILATARRLAAAAVGDIVAQQGVAAAVVAPVGQAAPQSDPSDRMRMVET